MPPGVYLGRQTVRGVKRWLVEWREAGKRRRRFYTSKASAEAYHAELTAQQRVDGEVWATLDAEERADLLKLYRDAKSVGSSLRQAWSEWSAKPAVQADTMTLRRAIDECLQSKIAAHRRQNYIDSLQQALDAFARGRDQMPLASVTIAEVEAWITSKSPYTRQSRLGRLGTLFSWAVRRGYLAVNPCAKVERVSITYTPPTILTVEQSKAVLEFVRENHPDAIACFVLALLAGIRPEECDKLDWSAVDLAAGLVTISPAVSKVRQRRIVHLMPNAREWLELGRTSTLPLPYWRRRRVLFALREKLGFDAWPKDVMRHTAASMLLAHWQDAAKVALELGNSPAVLLRHYRELVRRDTAGEFWGLRP